MNKGPIFFSATLFLIAVFLVTIFTIPVKPRQEIINEITNYNVLENTTNTFREYYNVTYVYNITNNLTNTQLEPVVLRELRDVPSPLCPPFDERKCHSITNLNATIINYKIFCEGNLRTYDCL